MFERAAGDLRTGPRASVSLALPAAAYRRPIERSTLPIELLPDPENNICVDTAEVTCANSLIRPVRVPAYLVAKLHGPLVQNVDLYGSDWQRDSQKDEGDRRDREKIHQCAQRLQYANIGERGGNAPQNKCYGGCELPALSMHCSNSQSEWRKAT